MREMPDLKSKIATNGSYKIVAFFVALVLWVVIIGRKDNLVIEGVSLQYKLSQGLSLSSLTVDQVELKLSGSRLTLRKLKKWTGPVSVDISEFQKGKSRIKVANKIYGLPKGVKIVSTKPSLVLIDLK